uniref:Uncharacterized protein n=1 Tax=Pediastrum duplex TaxID=3105 RepID=A0A1W5RMR8_PEDDU|nr:hypothetical protein [Pediastrum duplex]AQU64464.1 hypothetical protein [Pediastrum duplex]
MILNHSNNLFFSDNVADPILRSTFLFKVIYFMSYLFCRRKESKYVIGLLFHFFFSSYFACASASSQSKRSERDAKSQKANKSDSMQSKVFYAKLIIFNFAGLQKYMLCINKQK